MKETMEGAPASRPRWMFEITFCEQALPSVHIERWPITVGRAPGCDIKLGDGHVSAIHAEVQYDGERFWVRDISSTNGTFIDGEPVDEETQLQPGQRLCISDYALVITEVSEANLLRSSTSSPMLTKHPTKFGLPFASPEGDVGSWQIQPGVHEADSRSGDILLEVADFRGRRLSEIWRMILTAQGRAYEDWPLGARGFRLTATELTPAFKGRRAGASGQLLLVVSTWLETFCPRVRSPLASIWASGVLEVESGLRSVNGAAAKALHVLDYARSQGGAHMLVVPEANHIEIAHALGEHEDAVVLLTFAGSESFLQTLTSALARTSDGALLVVCFLFSPIEELANLLEAIKLLAHGLLTRGAMSKTKRLSRPRMSFIRVLNPSPRAPEALPLRSGGRLHIGASLKCELCLPGQNLEELHCSIFLGDGAPILTNHARGGTFIADQRLGVEESTPLARDVLVRVGDALLVLEELIAGEDQRTPPGVDAVTGLTKRTDWVGGIAPEQWVSVRLDLSAGTKRLTHAQLEARYFAPWRRWVFTTLRARHPGCVLLYQEPSRLLVLLEPARGWGLERIRATLASGEPSWLTSAAPDRWTHEWIVERSPERTHDERLEDRLARLEALLLKRGGD